ncbi:hypothetical protein TNCV_2025081 [Trichonephila clavipes]|nr:hypothetical protein TNCV_2025081 [Trichonephila clavipes]
MGNCSDGSDQGCPTHVVKSQQIWLAEMSQLVGECVDPRRMQTALVPFKRHISIFKHLCRSQCTLDTSRWMSAETVWVILPIYQHASRKIDYLLEKPPLVTAWHSPLLP